MKPPIHQIEFPANMSGYMVCITKVTFCIFVVRLTIFELDAVPQMSSWRHVVGGRGHCHQQASRVRDGCFVVKNM